MMMIMMVVAILKLVMKLMVIILVVMMIVMCCCCNSCFILFQVNYLQQSIRPLAYISNEIMLEEFLNEGKVSSNYIPFFVQTFFKQLLPTFHFQPSLLGFFNGTDYEDVNYNEFFGAAFHTINTGF